MFDALFNERLTRFGTALTCRHADIKGVMPVRRLLEQDVLEDVLTRFSAHHGPYERRAVATQWSKHYLSQLIIPITVVELCRDVHLPTSLDDMGVVLGEDGTPQQFVLPHEGTISLDNGCARFCPLIARHLTPLIETLARKVHFSPRVLWSNAGVYFEFAVNELERQGLASAFEIQGARAMMELRQLPDRQRNPFYRPVDYIDVVDDSGAAEPWRCRRMCCLRYLDETLGLCGNCPRLKTTRADEHPAQA
ncbi:ferric iron reductase FhuF [Kushneria pakistanensis]|uniref:Ferric iron reductase FhuF n=1 Tax=Kushneria pakistanensis TaxID=1508770 RepID=A0ABQ3FKE6_9GAMM|nr:siderophore-iron reductase FhuF [Kushneria pakistanensis]GHC26760.1 ferric iron reductase FhuF [Kushneria pakistanensis]